MKLIDTEETVLIVTGAELKAEMLDRPLAYLLKEEIDRVGGGVAYRQAVVVSDRWFGENRIFHLCPAIAVGGPGVNALAADVVERLPMIDQPDDRTFVQGAWDGDEKRASLWGLDRVATRKAVEAFVQNGHCRDLLRTIWKDAPSRV